MGKFLQTRLAIVAALTLEAASAAFLSPQLNNLPDLGSTSVPLLRRSLSPQTKDDWGEWAYAHKQALHQKYGGDAKEKRSTGTNRWVNLVFIG